MSDLVERLRGLGSPDAERISDYQRINEFCKSSHEAADRIEALEKALRMLIDNVETGSYESTGEAIKIARTALSQHQTK